MIWQEQWTTPGCKWREVERLITHLQARAEALLPKRNLVLSCHASVHVIILQQCQENVDQKNILRKRKRRKAYAGIIARASAPRSTVQSGFLMHLAPGLIVRSLIATGQLHMLCGKWWHQHNNRAVKSLNLPACMQQCIGELILSPHTTAGTCSRLFKSLLNKSGGTGKQRLGC